MNKKTLIKSLLREVYQKIPFKKNLFLLIKGFIELPPEIYRRLYFEDEFLVKVEDKSFRIHNGRQLVENEIFWKGLFGSWEKMSLYLWAELSKRSEVILDIGANTGIYSLLAKAVNPTSKVYAFEPFSNVYSRLIRNIKLNNFDIKAIKKAVSNKDGLQLIFDMLQPSIYSATLEKRFYRDVHQVGELKLEQIETISLKTFFEEEELRRVDLVKIDVELHEPKVLEGFGNYLERFKPIIILEVLKDDVGTSIERIIDSKGYSYFYIDDENMKVVPSKKILARESRNYLICPQSASPLIENLSRQV